MKVFSITYDLHRPGQDYESLYEAIKSYETWCHYQDSAWVIVSSRSAAQIRDHLWQHMDRNDSLLVARLAGEAAWQGLPDDVSKWLKQNLEALVHL